MLSDSAVRYAFMICSEKERYKSGIYCACRETREWIEEMMQLLCESYHDSILWAWRTRFGSPDRCVVFKNGSIIRLCTANDCARGQKFNLIIFDKEINPTVLYSAISPSDLGDRFEYNMYHYERETNEQADAQYEVENESERTH